MTRIVMFVFNDCRTDARVLREAGSLTAAGHQVSIIARPTDPVATHGDREERDGFEIIRVPVPHRWRFYWTWLRYPWRMRRWWVGRLNRAVRGLPAGIIEIAGLFAAAVVTLPWAVIRFPFYARARRRPARSGGSNLDWLVRWRYAIGGWAAAAASAAPPAEIEWGHDLSGLAAAVAARRADPGRRVVYDSHEIYLEARSSAEQPAWARRIVAASERRWIAEVDAVVTVNEALAADLDRRYRRSATAGSIAVIHNCPARWTPAPDDGRRLRDRLGLEPSARIAIHHGVFARHRGVEELAAAMLEPGLERLHVVLLGSGPCRAAFDRLAQDPATGGRLHVLDAVDPDELLGWLAGADVGVMPIQPTTLNHRLATPNKLFECLAAGVPVVVSDFPGMRGIVLEDPAGPLGAVCDPTKPASIAAAIRSIIELPDVERAALRGRCLTAAHERWNWETESVPLLEVAARLGPGAGA